MSDSETPASKKGLWERLNNLNVLASLAVTLASLLGGIVGLRSCSFTSRPPVVVHFFDVKPARIEPGNLVLLSWDVKNAERVVIEPSTIVGDVQPQGSRQVPVTSTTTFVLTAYAPGVAPSPVSRTVQVAKTQEQPKPTVYRPPVMPAVQVGTKQVGTTASSQQTSAVQAQSHTIPRVIVLGSQLSSNVYASSLAEEASESLRENLRSRGFDVLAASGGSQTIEQYASQYRSLATAGRTTDGPDLVAQVSLQIRQEQRQSVTSSLTSSFITKLTKAQSAPTMDLISTCSASVNVVHLPEGQYVARGQSDDVRATNSVDTQMAGWQSAQNDLTISSARRAVAQALSRLALHP
ncbi:MAG TPA: hypothetical protein VEG68_08345 [Terriglobales bacterium]|nr:hypothetical protein [Terriglobales bacterium]